MGRITTKLSVPLVMIVLAAAACASPGGAASPVAPAASSQPPTEAAPTQPAATEVATQAAPAPGGAVSFGGVSFTLDPSLGTAAGSQVPADAAGNGAPEWLLPARISFELTGYPASSTRQASILVFPVAALKTLNPTGGQRVDMLSQMLQTKPAEDAITQDISQLSDLAQGEMLRAQVKYLNFANGSGVRFVTQFSSDVRPISNQDLVYVFQGITSDGANVVAIQLPISESDLPSGDESMSPDQLNQLAQNYDQYIKDTTGMLDQAPDTSFSPTLSALDKLVESLTANPAIQ